MAKISKRADAPEGDIKVSVGSSHMKVTDDKPYETDDQLLIAEAEASDYFDVEYEEEADTKAVAREETKLLKELDKQRAKADKQRAEKDPEEPAAPKPENLADVKETKEAEAKADTAKEGKN